MASATRTRARQSRLPHRLPLRRPVALLADGTVNTSSHVHSHSKPFFCSCCVSGLTFLLHIEMFLRLLALSRINGLGVPAGVESGSHISCSYVWPAQLRPLTPACGVIITALLGKLSSLHSYLHLLLVNLDCSLMLIQRVRRGGGGTDFASIFALSSGAFTEFETPWKMQLGRRRLRDRRDSRARVIHSIPWNLRSIMYRRNDTPRLCML